MNELQQNILQLSVPERLQLISFIAASISEEAISQTIPEEWIKEANASIDRAMRGEEEVFSWEDVKARVYGQDKV